MFQKIRTLIVIVSAGLLVAACASLSAKPAFDDVAFEISQRTGKTIAWDEGSEDDVAARDAIAALLARPLTVDSATQIALLNNRGLQSSYTELGIAQAALVQAGLLKNPAFDASIIDPVPDGLPANLAFGVVFQFIDALQIPLRRRVAASKLEEAKIQITMQVIDHAAMVQMAFVDYLAAKQGVELFVGVERAARASLEAAEALREAGNVPALDVEREKSQHTLAKIELAQMRLARDEAREKVNVALGLDEGETDWRSISRLPVMPQPVAHLNLAEARALGQSLDMAARYQRLETLAHRYGVERLSSIIPDLELGFEIEREEADKEWRRGPTFGLVLPVFDQGRAKRRSTEMEIRRAQDAFADTAIRVRSAARVARARLSTARRQAELTNRQLVPQMTKVLSETQKNYNAMQLGVFQLLRAKRGQIDAGRSYIRALQEYWRARIRFEKLMSGRMPEPGGGAAQLVQSGGDAMESGGH